jgi:hypothetical protein
VCCSAAALLVVLCGWRVAETSAPLSAPVPSSPPAHAMGPADVDDVASLTDRRVVAELPVAKRVELERLAAVMVAAALFGLVALDGGLAAVAHAVRSRRERWRLRSRSPPLSFVSRP